LFVEEKKMSLSFHSSMKAKVSVAQAAVGCPQWGFSEEMSPREVRNLLAENGLVEKPLFSFLPVREIEIRGAGTLPTFDQMKVVWDSCLEVGKVVYKPLIYFLGDKRPDITKKVREALSSAFPTFILPLEEEVVKLPIPDWYSLQGDGDGAYLEVVAQVILRSDAERMWAKFIAQNPFATPAAYKVINLFTRTVKQVRTEQEAVAEVTGMAGAIVVDSAEGRVYDGEYQTWRAMSEYLAAFPAVAWIAEL
jgi:hypothetical protein